LVEERVRVRAAFLDALIYRRSKENDGQEND
jgi:hypothetical protein